MNNNVIEEDNTRIEQEPTISNGDVIKHPLSTFNNLLEEAVTELFLEGETDEDDNDLNVLRASVQHWRLKYKNLKRQAKLIKLDVERSIKDLTENKRAHPNGCTAGSVGQVVDTSTKLALAKAREKYKYLSQIVMTDSDDDDVIITTSKSQTENEDIIIDLIDSDDDTQNSMVKYKPGPKSKTNVFILNHKPNDYDNVLPIVTEVSPSLCNEKCSSTSIRKRKPGPKSKTMFVDDIVL